jgi:tripartite-type tricarboxylate transporter receptor subunit TctC
MKKVKISGRVGLLGLGIGLLTGLSLATVPGDAAAWQPKKPVEFVIMAGKGGGADKAVRFMQNIIAKNKLSSKPFTPINKPGGTGAEALVHLKNAKDPNHTIMFTLNSFYTTPLRQPGIKVDISKFTPIGRMAEDTFLLWVNKDSGITNVKQFVKAAKAKGNAWIMAGTGKNSEDNILTDFLNKAYGLNMKYVPYKGGGRGAAWLLSGRQDRPAGGFHAATAAVVRRCAYVQGVGQGLRLLHAAHGRWRAGHEQGGGDLLPPVVRPDLQLRRVAGLHDQKEPSGRFPYRQRPDEVLAA